MSDTPETDAFYASCVDREIVSSLNCDWAIFAGRIERRDRDTKAFLHEIANDIEALQEPSRITDKIRARLETYREAMAS